MHSANEHTGQALCEQCSIPPHSPAALPCRDGMLLTLLTHRCGQPHDVARPLLAVAARRLVDHHLGSGPRSGERDGQGPDNEAKPERGAGWQAAQPCPRPMHTAHLLCIVWPCCSAIQALSALNTLMFLQLSMCKEMGRLANSCTLCCHLQISPTDTPCNRTATFTVAQQHSHHADVLLVEHAYGDGQVGQRYA